MKRVLSVLVTLACGLAFAAEPKPAAPAPAAKTETPAKMEAAKPEAAKPMAMAWKPRKVTKEDKKGIDELYKKMQEAMMKGDAEAMAALVDFPIFMLTDSQTGVTMGGTWEKDKWMGMMKGAMENMPKDMKPTHKYKTFFISDSLAMAMEDNAATMGKQKMDWRSGSLMVMKDGKWMFKGMIEGGWGEDTAKGASAPAPAAGQQTGSR